MFFSDWGSKRRAGVLACAVAAGGMMMAATPAQAWWRGGVWIGVPPVVIGAPAPAYYPPYYYPPYYPYAYPPAYYPPPPAYPQSQAQPQTQPETQPQTQPGAQQSQAVPNQQVAYGSTCYAGVYVCAAPGNTPVNAGCSCPGIGAPSYGVVR